VESELIDCCLRLRGGDLAALSELANLLERDCDVNALARRLRESGLADSDDGPWRAAWWNQQRRDAVADAEQLREDLAELVEPLIVAAREHRCILHDWDPQRGWVWPAEMQ